LIPAPRVKSGTGKQTTKPNRSFLASSDHRILKRDAFGIVFLEPSFGGIFVGEDLEMVDVADILFGVDVIQTVFIGPS
jgi:hypothetical protein